MNHCKNYPLDNSGKFIVERLSNELCLAHQDEILSLINQIPFIHWSISDLLSQKEDYFGCKWNYSYLVFNEENKAIGVLIAYFRMSDNRHIFDSLYLHRLSIAHDYQRQGIGTKILKFFIERAFFEIPWLLNISAQTNDNEENQGVIHFYLQQGFRILYNVFYPEKKDVLLLLERNKVLHRDSFLNNEKSYLPIKHPRLDVHAENGTPKNVLPVIYFSSTNELKRQIVEFIFNNYNIAVSFVRPPIELTEPQIEHPGIEEERKLVSLPLKSVSRFINTFPYVIEDSMLFVEFFNRFGEEWELPGLDTKRWLRQMGLDGMLEIMGNTDKRRARLVSQTGAYLRPNRYAFGRGELTGVITNKVIDIPDNRFGIYPYFFHRVFVPDGCDKTLAEMNVYEYAQFDYMRKGILQLIADISHISLNEQQISLFDY